MFPPVRVLIMIGCSWITAPIQTYFGVEVLVRSSGVHAGPATAPSTGGGPHETVILIRFSLVGNTVPIATENVPPVAGGPTVAGRVVQVAAETVVRLDG